MTKKVEWFRRSTWSDRDAEEFAQRLASSRGSSRKAQYLRIQALHLFEAGDLALTRAALGLLDQLIADYPEPFDLARAHSLRAECLVDLGRPDEALTSYERSLEARRSFPQVGDDGYWGYAELIIALGRNDLFTTALKAIEEFDHEPLFPVQEYRIAAARALIATELGDHDAATRFAMDALAAAGKAEAPFRYHRTLGLVRGLDPLVHERLKQLGS